MATIGLGTDPAYLAFLRALGLEESFDEDDAAYEVDNLRADLNRQLPRIAEQGIRVRKGISSNYGGRGLYRSGGHEMTLARQRADEAQDVGDLQYGAARSEADMLRDLARRRIRRQTGAAEQALSTGTRIDSEVY